MKHGRPGSNSRALDGSAGFQRLTCGFFVRGYASEAGIDQGYDVGGGGGEFIGCQHVLGLFRVIFSSLSSSVVLLLIGSSVRLVVIVWYGSEVRYDVPGELASLWVHTFC